MFRTLRILTLQRLLAMAFITSVSAIMLEPLAVSAAPAHQQLPAPLADYASLSLNITNGESVLDLTRVDFWPTTIIFLGTWTTGTESECIYRSDFVLEINGNEYEAASRDTVDDEIYPGIGAPGSGLFGLCGSNESQLIAIPFNAILSDEPVTFSYGEAVELLPESLLGMRDARITPEPTATPTITPTPTPSATLTPSATPTPTFTPAVASFAVVDMANFAVPFSDIASSVAISGAVGNNGIHFYLERIDLWNELPGGRSPRNDIFVVLTGYLLPGGAAEGNACVGANDIHLLVGSSQYEMDNMRDAQRFYDVDFPGYILPQCVSGNELEPTFLVFDLKVTSERVLLSFHDTLLNVGATLSELESASTVPSLGVASSLDGPVSETSAEAGTRTPPDTPLLATATLVPSSVLSTTKTPEPSPTDTLTATGAPTSAPVVVYVVQGTTLYAGPAETFAIAGSAEPGEFLTVVAQDKTGYWYELKTGQWIAASAVNEISVNLPVSEPTTVPTNTITPTDTPLLVATETVLQSQGLGMTFEDWKEKHGEPNTDMGGTYIFKNPTGTYFVIEYNDRITHIDQGWSTVNMPSMDEAKLAAEQLMPIDAEYQDSYTADTGSYIEVYFSQQLATLYPNALYLEGDTIGEFIVSYRRQPDGKVTSIAVATGNNP